MTTGIDEIDWGSLQDAYGPADGFPRLLAAVTAPDPGVREEAVHELFGTVHHQGTLYSSTPHAVPFLARPRRPTPSRSSPAPPPTPPPRRGNARAWSTCSP
ncbi:hypothetical protein DZF91_17835 [Actinomadura logoneensis]|uniref:Uncharacterized protein n=1 Tax=Actinomadura logoneensis TaxID=2293572 RepID=A0A372JJS9_9ACTN|nr:hypothetical protein [Actinomadura logoneensis]RFU40283.1 hypothetical protein DZF91_17835 [Actinomadura logoneensis]